MITAMTANHTHAATGWQTLVRFMLRRDRYRILIWAVATAGVTAGSLSTLSDTYADPETRQALEATMENPAMIALTGQNYAPGEYSIGVMMGQQMLVWTLLTVAIMAVLMIVRHTRAEEASGRAELIRAGVVGRQATNLAALAVTGIATVAMAVALALALGSAGEASMTWSGAVLYGGSHVAVGMAFAAIALTCAQVSEYPRGAAGLGLAAVGAAFVIRGVGDVTGGGLSWLSPFGWGQATYVFHDNRWWPLAIAVGFATAVGGAGMWLSTRRDLAAGLRAPRSAPARAGRGLLSTWLFTMRLQRGMLMGWTAGMALLGLSYGSVLGDVESFMEQFEQLDEVFEMGPGVDPLTSFQATMMMVMAVIASSAAVLSVQRLRSEESDGRLEVLIIAGQSRRNVVLTHVAAAVFTGMVVLMAAGGGLGLAGYASTGDSALVGQSLLAAVGYFPALWLVSAVGLAVMGWMPRLTNWVWALVAFSFVAVYLRGLIGLPEWLEYFSPFGYVPQYPLEAWSVTVFVLMTALAAGVFAVAGRGFVRRDIQSAA